LFKKPKDNQISSLYSILVRTIRVGLRNYGRLLLNIVGLLNIIGLGGINNWCWLINHSRRSIVWAWECVVGDCPSRTKRCSSNE
jgi:hypothetical protein